MNKIQTRLSLIQDKFIYIPLVDIFFILLIFILLSNSFVQIPAIDIQLPSVPGQPISTERLVISIDKDNRFYFNDQVMDLKKLKEEMALISSQYEINSVILQADTNTPHGEVSKILSLANSLDLNVYFAVSSAPESTRIEFEREK